MLNRLKRTQIQIDTHDVTIIRRQRHQFSVFCQRCQRDVSTFTPEQVERWLRLIRSGDMHLIETEYGPLVCANAADIH